METTKIVINNKRKSVFILIPGSTCTYAWKCLRIRLEMTKTDKYDFVISKKGGFFLRIVPVSKLSYALSFDFSYPQKQIHFDWGKAANSFLF